MIDIDCYDLKNCPGECPAGGWATCSANPEAVPRATRRVMFTNIQYDPEHLAILPRFLLAARAAVRFVGFSIGNVGFYVVVRSRPAAGELADGGADAPEAQSAKLLKKEIP